MNRVVVCGESLVDLVPVSGEPLSPLAPRPGRRADERGRDPSVASEYRPPSARACPPTASVTRSSATCRHPTSRPGLIQRGDEPTTLAVVELTDGAAAYSFYVGATADRLVTDPGPLPEDVAAVSFGTLSLVLEPGASVYETVLRREHAAGRLTVLDPNIRAELIPDADAFRERFRSWLPCVDVLKLSDVDARWLGGSPPQWLDAGGGGRRPDPGGRRARGAHPRRARCRPARPPPRSATPSARATPCTGPLLAALYRRDALSRDAVAGLDAAAWREAAEFAARAAAITVSRPGADPPWAHELLTPVNSADPHIGHSHSVTSPPRTVAVSMTGPAGSTNRS